MARFGFWILVFGFLALTGCARMVTSIVSYGNQMMVEVTLRGTMDAKSNRYFMILSSSPSFKVPLPPPDNISFECLEPGSSPQQGALADYFANFYSTWGGYVIAEPGGYFTAPGPFVQGSALTREVLTALGSPTSKIKFTFSLSRIFGSSVPSTIYFDFLAVPWPSGGAKLPADHLKSTNAYISKVAGSTISLDDGTNASLDAALDIIKCTVAIQ